VNAGIDKAAGIIITLPFDKDNLYITTTARMQNPKIRIITRVTDKKIEPKLKKAGANGIVSPQFHRCPAHGFGNDPPDGGELSGSDASQRRRESAHS